MLQAETDRLRDENAEDRSTGKTDYHAGTKHQTRWTERLQHRHHGREVILEKLGKEKKESRKSLGKTSESGFEG